MSFEKFSVFLQMHYVNTLIHYINVLIMNDNKVMNRAADNIRILAASMVEKAKSGHPGGAMGGADFINTLYSEFLVYDPENPAAVNRYGILLCFRGAWRIRTAVDGFADR